MKNTLNTLGRHTVNILLLTLICILYFSTAHPTVQSAGVGQTVFSPIYRGRTKEKIALLIAVDWDAEKLPLIMEVLKKKEANVTFAVSGSWAQRNPDVLQKIVGDGHEIAVMGYRAMTDGDKAWLHSDITSSLEAIKDACGFTPTLYYPGQRNIKRSARAASELDLTTVVGSADLLCGRGNSLDILNRALENLFDGSIMLLQPTAAAEKALPSIVEAIRAEDFSVCKVGDVLSKNKTG